MHSIQALNNETENKGLIASSDRNVQIVVKTAEDELRQLLRERTEIMKRIGTIKQTIFGLVKLFGNGILNEDLPAVFDSRNHGRQPGFTRACRMVLMEATAPLAAREVCEQIQQMTPPMIQHHKDPLASVTTVLNRLVEYGEARSLVSESGRRTWQWVADPGEGVASQFTSVRDVAR
ncbi:MAG TPA: hypothetical protein VH079_18035 [Terriglobales bacterium]|jgi:hypothetical protein|nr:hypothetical protein [Terriglobales bacterium]